MDVRFGRLDRLDGAVHRIVIQGAGNRERLSPHRDPDLPGRERERLTRQLPTVIRRIATGPGWRIVPGDHRPNVSGVWHVLGQFTDRRW